MGPAQLAVAIRGFNAIGRSLRRVHPSLLSLDRDALVEHAVRRTRLDDFGGDEFREPLRMLLASLEADAHLTPLGRLTARQDTLSLLENRLRLVEDRKRDPAIAGREIRAPLFIVGLPRTGSTLLHHLMAQDPAARVTRAWQVMFPSPPPRQADDEDDPRIARAERQLRWLDRLAPQFKTIHPLGARLAIECLAITSYTFLSWRFNTMYRVPTYQQWLGTRDHRPAYAFHRRFLQHLAWRDAGERWVLKAPSHVHGFGALFETYPDAMVVQTHRDPAVVLPSVASLTAVLRAPFTEHVDPREIGREVTAYWASGVARAIELRTTSEIPSERFVDVHYHELLADPVGTVRRVYRHFDLWLGTDAERAMRRHLAENPQGKNGRHAYAPASFGLDPDDIAGRFEAYRDHFGVPRESVPPVSG